MQSVRYTTRKERRPYQRAAQPEGVHVDSASRLGDMAEFQYLSGPRGTPGYS